MFRALLPAAVFISTLSAQAEELRVPGLAPDGPPKLELPACDNHPYSKKNCVRVLACVGSEGVWFDGQARGWDQGTVVGQMSDGAPCAGEWNSNGLFGTGNSSLQCQDGLRAQVIYHTQDNETGTVIGSGLDSKGRRIKVWTGLNVLEFLTPDGKGTPELPCLGGPVLIS